MTVVAHALPARSVVVATGVHDIDDAVEPAIVRDAVLEVPSVTVTVAPDGMKAFRQARFDVKKMAGKRVRVRGWLERFNGPEMEIATPAAIEILK